MIYSQMLDYINQVILFAISSMKAYFIDNVYLRLAHVNIIVAILLYGM